MKNDVKKSDMELKDDVLAELKFEPSVRVTEIGVLVKNGTVTLNGFVTNYGEKWDAVRATKRVAGVCAIADDIEVRLPDSLRRTDGDIAAAATHQISWSTTIPAGNTQVTVREGWITVEGEVEWRYQRNAAENVVQYLAGVKGVTNLITVKPTLAAADVKTSIESAFARNAFLDAREVQVETLGSNVILHGKVHNHAESDEAERIAWAAPGVFAVDNQLKIGWSWGSAE